MVRTAPPCKLYMFLLPATWPGPMWRGAVEWEGNIVALSTDPGAYEEHPETGWYRCLGTMSWSKARHALLKARWDGENIDDLEDIIYSL